MLPDFPNSKQKILKGIHRRIDQLERQLHPVLAKVGRYTQQEGTAVEFEQVGFGMKSQEAQEYSVAVEIKPEEVPNLVGAALEAKLRTIAEEMGGLKVKTMMEHIGEATELTGNRIDARGEKLSGKMVLDMMERAEESFDKSGNPKSSFLVHPDMLPILKKIDEEVENDPELKQRLVEIKRRKFEEWADRESRRKLVD
jgi:hypothetical protein